MPLLYRPPPFPATEPSLILSPESEAVTPPSIWSTRHLPPALIVTPAVGPMIDIEAPSVPDCRPLIERNGLGVAKSVGSNEITGLPPSVLARVTA